MKANERAKNELARLLSDRNELPFSLVKDGTQSW